MGNRTRKTIYDTSFDLRAQILEKDEKITWLESQVEAYNAKASHAQARLLATFDALDSLQSKHALELSSEKLAKERLSIKLDRYLDYVKAVETEKDDLKDAVEHLIQKVEVSNDMSLWPFSRMRISSLADPMQSNKRKEVEECNTQLLAYASGIITKLRAERDLERKGHRETYEKANNRIVELEAQIALREAELEACVQHGCTHSQSVQTSDTRRKTKARLSSRLPAPNLTDEDCLKVLTMADAKNKTLEQEVRDLLERLDKARSVVPTSSQQVDSRYQAEPQQVKESADALATPASVPRRNHFTSAPAQPKQSSEEVHTIAVTATVLPGNTIEDVRQVSLPVTGSARDAQTPAPVLNNIQTIGELSNQITALRSRMNALKSEKSAIVDLIDGDKEIPHGATTDNFDYILLVEEECIRLDSQVQCLQRELENCQNAATSREKQLLDEIERLKASGRSPSAVQIRAVSPEHIEDDFDVGQSMDLATPLQPTSILIAPTQECERSLVTDPSWIPLPPSPRSLSPGPLINWSPPPGSGQPSSHEKLMQVSGKLERAKSQLDEKEILLAELRADMENLQQQILSRK